MSASVSRRFQSSAIMSSRSTASVPEQNLPAQRPSTHQPQQYATEDMVLLQQLLSMIQNIRGRGSSYGVNAGTPQLDPALFADSMLAYGAHPPFDFEGTLGGGDEGDGDEDYDEDDEDEEDDAREEKDPSFELKDVQRKSLGSTPARGTDTQTNQARPHAATEKKYRVVVNAKVQQLNALIPPSGLFLPKASNAYQTTSYQKPEQTAPKPVVLDKAIQYVEHLVQVSERYDSEMNDLVSQVQGWLTHASGEAQGAPSHTPRDQ